MRVVCCLLFLFLCGSAWAAGADEYGACVEYMNSNTVVHPVGDYIFENTTNGLRIAYWGLPTPQPTFEQMDAIMPQALAWKSNQVASAAADIDKMEIRLKAVIRGLVKVINERLPDGKKITEAELREAIKNEAK